MKDAYFVDTEGASWHLHIAFGDVMRVKKHVLGIDGKPLDLCFIAETGDFRQVTDHIEIVVQCVFWLLYKDICKYTSKKNALEWFYSRIDGNVLPNLTKAWFEALINFTPFPPVQAAMMTARELQTKEELIAAINLLAGQLVESTNSPASLESTQDNTVMVNSQRWLSPV